MYHIICDLLVRKGEEDSMTSIIASFVIDSSRYLHDVVCAHVVVNNSKNLLLDHEI